MMDSVQHLRPAESESLGAGPRGKLPPWMSRQSHSHECYSGKSHPADMQTLRWGWITGC